MKIKKAVLKFRLEKELPLSYGHKLRGFFANRFQELLFHNHLEDGGYRYGYPLLQYKIIEGQPTVLGLARGAELIIKNFLEIEELKLAGERYANPEGRLEVLDQQLEVSEQEYEYDFYSPWLGLNQKNYKRYINQKDASACNQFLKSILIGNILSFAKGVDWWIEKEIKVDLDLEELTVNFKNQTLLAFKGSIITNVLLPELIGLGKSTARGFGSIKKSN